MIRFAMVSWTMVAITLSASTSRADYGAFDGEVTYVYREYFYLQADNTYEFETRNLSPGGDTVMYLWYDQAGEQVAYNDDYEGLASRISYTPRQSGYYLLIVRSYSNSSQGGCDIWYQGQQHQTTTFGGWHIAAGNGTGDVYETVHLLGGATDTLIFLFRDEDARLFTFDDDSGVGMAAKLDPEWQFQGRLVISTYVGGPEAVLARVLVNDKYSDQDGDGLGHAFETAICSCDDTTSQFSCYPGYGSTLNVNCAALVGTPKDTDNDGLEDGWEVFGIDDASFPQLLPMWGANPLRKDLFVEMDWNDLTSRVAPTPAVNVASIFGASQTSAALANPDGTDGVKVHLDIGQSSPCSVQNDPVCTMYGNWGGAQQPTAQPYWTCQIDRSFHWTQQPTGNPCTTIPLDYVIEGGVWSPSYQAFAEVRRGVFHYAVTVASGGGKGLQPGWRFWASGAGTEPTTSSRSRPRWVSSRHPPWSTRRRPPMTECSCSIATVSTCTCAGRPATSTRPICQAAAPRWSMAAVTGVQRRPSSPGAAPGQTRPQDPRPHRSTSARRRPAS